MATDSIDKDLKKLRATIKETNAATVVSAARIKALEGVLEAVRLDALDVPEHTEEVLALADELDAAIEAARDRKQAPVRKDAVPARNEPCTCGSGKKYKTCHGR